MTLPISPAATDALMRAAVTEARRRTDMRRMASTRGVEFRGGNLAALSNHDAEMVLSGPAGTGKTRANLTYINDAMWTYPNLRVLIIRKVKADLAETALVTFERDVLGFDNPICQGATRQHRDAYRYPNGSMMVIAGMDRPGRVLSSEWDIIYVSEVNEISLDDWELLNSRLGRTLAYPHPQLRGDCNPDRPDHWLLHRGSLTMLYTTHKDNPAYFDRDGAPTELGTRYMSRLEALTGVRRERYLLGRWVMAEGAVYTQWDKGMHVIEPFDIPADWRRIRSIDFGYTNPFVCQWWAIDPDGRMYMYREIYKTQTLVEDHAARIKDLSAGERYQYTVADHDAEDRATLARHGIATVAANKKVLAGIQAVSERLTPAGDGKPRLFLFRDALVDRDMNLEAGKQPVRTEDEFGGYVWNDKVRKEEPVKQDDHGLDAARYAVMAVNSRVAPQLAANPFYGHGG